MRGRRVTAAGGNRHAEWSPTLNRKPWRILKRFVCGSIIPDCDRVFTGPGDQSVLDQALEHAARNHGLAAAPMPFIELVLTYTRPFTPTAGVISTHRGHLRVVPEPSRRAGTGATVHQLRGPDCERLRSSRAHDTYRHECLLYAGTGGFLAAVVPFVIDGLARQEPVLVAVAEPRLSALRAALSGDAERVIFADMAELGHNPALIIPAWREFIDRHGGAGQPVRGIGEPIWATRRPDVIAEAQFHEALLNVAVSPDTPLWLLCPYDTAALDDQVVDEATRSHPVIVQGEIYRGSTSYGGAAYVEQLFGSPLPPPRGEVTTIAFDPREHDHVADILTFAGRAGLRIDRAVKFAAAIDQVAAATTDMDIRVWSERGAVVCEVSDPDTVPDPMIGRGAGPRTVRDRAIRVANDLCDLVQVRSGWAGTATRIRCWL